MDDKQNKPQENAEMPEKALDAVTGGIFYIGQCNRHDPITENGVTKCRKCGLVYGQQVP